MRLATCLLIALATTVWGQEGRKLPWIVAEGLPWKSVLQFDPVPTPSIISQDEPGPKGQVCWSQDGRVEVKNERGTPVLQFGLPGRPLHLWQDDGRPLSVQQGCWRCPLDTPLLQGVSKLPLGQWDFRSALRGLIWLIDDSERLLTVVHPAARQHLHLPLPDSDNVTVCFFPDRLEVRQMGEGGKIIQGWSVMWLSLLPQFIRLSQPLPGPKPGTAFAPYPPSQ